MTKRLVLLFTAACIFYLAFLPPGIYSLDGNGMLAVAESIVTNHNTTVNSLAIGVAGNGGRLYSKWYPLQSFVVVPFVAVGIEAAHLVHLPMHYTDAMFAMVMQALVTAATLPLIVLVAMQLGATEASAYLAATAFACGTISLVYFRDFYAEPLLALLITLAVYLVLNGKLGLSGVAAALAILCKPAAIMVGPILSAYLIARNGTRQLMSSLIPAAGSAVGLLLYFAYNYSHFDNPLKFGPNLVLSWRIFPEGFPGLLISPGRGLLWYCPPVLLAFVAFAKARKRLEAWLIMLLFVAFLAFHACLGYWDGGWAWGPRYLLAVLPILMALTGTLSGRWKYALVAATIAGFLITAPTLVSYWERYFEEAKEQNISNEQLDWSLSNAPLIHAWPAAIREIRDARNSNVRDIFNDRGVPGQSIASSRALRVVAVWWWVLPVARISMLWGFALSVLAILIALYLVYRIAVLIPPESAP